MQSTDIFIGNHTDILVGKAERGAYFEYEINIGSARVLGKRTAISNLVKAIAEQTEVDLTNAIPKLREQATTIRKLKSRVATLEAQNSDEHKIDVYYPPEEA